MYNSLQIANYFLKRGQDTGTEITPMKLIKLVYIAHGWNLGFTGESLLTEQVYAWKYGPVIDTLYNTFKEYGSSPIIELYNPNVFDEKPPMPDKAAEPLLDAIWKAYGQFDGVQLSAMTHQEGTPWYITWHERGGKDGRHIPIANDLIEKHYKEKIDDIKKRTKQVIPA